MTKKEHAEFVARRAELMAELFLQDLGADFVGRATDPGFYDYLIGFSNRNGGIDTFAVEIKATDQPITDRWRVTRDVFNRAANSNIPVLLVVIDVKRNEIYFAWPADLENDTNGNSVSIPLTRVDDDTKAALRKRMAGHSKAVVSRAPAI